MPLFTQLGSGSSREIKEIFFLNVSRKGFCGKLWTYCQVDFPRRVKSGSWTIHFFIFKCAFSLIGDKSSVLVMLQQRKQGVFCLVGQRSFISGEKFKHSLDKLYCCYQVSTESLFDKMIIMSLLIKNTIIIFNFLHARSAKVWLIQAAAQCLETFTQGQITSGPQNATVTIIHVRSSQ